MRFDCRRRDLMLALAMGAIVLGAAAGCVRRPGGLLDASPRVLAQPAPDSFRVVFTTTKGDFTVLARRAWSPHGVDRFYYLAGHHFYDNTAFFRVLRNYVAQFGLSGDPRVAQAWAARTIPDDPPGRVSNRRGRVSFASAGRATRTTQLFINLVDNARLDTLGGTGYPPIGEVVAGMAVVEALHSGYGEGAPRGSGPNQALIAERGNTYLEREYPHLDWVRSTRVELFRR